MLGIVDRQDRDYGALAGLDAHHHLGVGMDQPVKVDEHIVQKAQGCQGTGWAKNELDAQMSYDADAESARNRWTDEGHESVGDSALKWVGRPGVLRACQGILCTRKSAKLHTTDTNDLP